MRNLPSTSVAITAVLLPPFPLRATPIPIANPIDRIHALVGAFVAAGLKGEAPKVE